MKFLDYVKSVVINTIIVDKHKYDVIHPFILWLFQHVFADYKNTLDGGS